MIFPIRTIDGITRFYIGLQCDITDETISFNHIMTMEDLIAILPKTITEDSVSDFPTDIVGAVRSWLKVVPQYPRPASSGRRLLPRINSSNSLVAPPPTPVLGSRRPNNPRANSVGFDNTSRTTLP
jgi:hypothetical protein